ncbi:MAG: hypothetical protein LUG50_15865 [Planctomycetaceae bacterium]|nr:hypothetical protein [Planctomycetaceae bacterium]
MTMTIHNQAHANHVDRYSYNFKKKNTASVATSSQVTLSDQHIRTSRSQNPETYTSHIAANRKVLDIASLEGRQNAAKDYDSILASLRAQYSESRAMSMFDEIMRADGFERIEYSDAHIAMQGGYSDTLTGLTQKPSGVVHEDQAALVDKLSPDTSSENMVLHSSLAAAIQGDKAVVSAESWAVYGASRPYSSELQAYWQGRYKEAVQDDADFDVDSYMAVLPESSQRSVVSVNDDLGTMVSRILAENGIELGSGEYLEFKIDAQDGIMVGGNWECGDYAFSDIFNASEEFVAAFKAQMVNPPLEDVTGLQGSFDQGDRSIAYSVSRSVIFSADTPSTAVVNDRLGVTGKGYTYVKKAGDYFDPNAGSYSITAKPQLYDHFTLGQEKFAENIEKCKNAANAVLTRAIQSGTPVHGDVSREEVEKIRAQSYTNWQNYNANLTMYDSSGNIVQGGEASHAEHASGDQVDDVPDYTPSTEKKDGKTEDSRKVAFEQLARQIRSRYSSVLTSKTTASLKKWS